MSVETDVQDLIAAYLSAWNARDYEAMAALFSEPAAYVLADGLKHIPDRAALVDSLVAQFAGLEGRGFHHTEIENVTVRACTETTALAEMKNVARLRADGSALEVIDAVYICVRQDGQWKLSIAMACQPGWNDV